MIPWHEKKFPLFSTRRILQILPLALSRGSLDPIKEILQQICEMIQIFLPRIPNPNKWWSHAFAVNKFFENFP